MIYYYLLITVLKRQYYQETYGKYFLYKPKFLVEEHLILSLE